MPAATATTGATATQRWARVAGWLLLSVCCLTAMAATSGVAAADDTSAPEWGNATVSRTSPAVLNVTFYDDERVDRDTISADDFDIDNGSVDSVAAISGVQTEGNRSGVRVTLLLEDGIRANNVTVGFAENGSIRNTANSDGDGPAGIADDAGNTLTAGRVPVNFVGSDTGAPQWGSATREEDTEINVTVYDNVRVDPSSISAGDFSLSSGSVANVSTVQLFDDGNRSGAYFVLLLNDRVDTDNVTVGFREGGSITDTDGNELASGNVTASGMDSVVPDDEGYDLQRLNQSTVQIRVETNERLDGITMNILGPVDGELSRANFTETVGETAVYTANYTVPEEGSYTFVWARATDRSGNFLRLSETRDFEYDDGHPDIVLDGADNTTVGTAVNFSAANSRADGGITGYQWRIDGGTILTGESIDIAFAVPGSHEIVVEVTGANGNTSVERRTVQVAAANDSAVSLSQRNATYATASVEGTGFVQQIRATDGSVVEASNVSLDRLSAAFPSESTVNLTVGVTDAVPPSLNATGVGLFEIGHGNATAEQVNLRFGVNRTGLNRTGASPADVTLYRNDSGWTPLETSVVSRDSARIVYQADSPGLSQFAVGVSESDGGGTEGRGNETENGNETKADGNTTATTDSGNTTIASNETTDGGNTTVASTETRDDGNTTVASNETTDGGNTTLASNATSASGNTSGTNTTSASSADTINGTAQPAGYPDIVVTNVTVNETNPSVGDNVSINVTAENRGTQAGNYSVAVVLNNTTLATHEMDVQPGESRTQQFVHQLPEAGALAVDDQRVANVSSGGGLVSMLPGPLSGVVSALPNPLALWPDGIVGTILGGLVGLIVAVYAVLKALAIYLGY